jgi:FtsP/CotA-like multicopper oxidase with cupredoxin domain
MILTSSRRAFLTTAAGAAACATLATRASAQGTSNSGAEGFRVLRAKALSTTSGPSEDQPWGYDGIVPGPLLRVRQGDELKIRLVNELAAATAIHWHGIRAPNAMDGVPHLTQAPAGESARFEYRLRAMDAGTFWYHAPYILPGQCERGLHGVLIVDEKTPVEVDRDAVLVFDGRPRPAETIATQGNERLRIRLLNASKARMASFRFDRHAIRVMAIDGQPAEPFLAHESRVSLGPGNRIDLFVDAVLEPGASASIFLDEAGRETEIARLVYDGAQKRRTSPLPDPRPLPANPLPERIDMRNAFRIEAPLHDSPKPVWTNIAPSPGPFGPPLFSVKRGRAVVLTFPNQSDTPHAVHLHGHHVRLLDNLDDGWKPFWLDTIMAGPRRTTRVAFVADNPGRWLLHAQPLGRDIGMVAWFEVT